MTTPDIDSDLSATAKYLQAEHAAFSARFDDLCERARSGDWRIVDEVWDGFVRDVEAHFNFEESAVFPLLRVSSSGGATVTQRLLDQHGEIRRRLAELGVGIQLHCVDEGVIAALVANLREHAATENEQLYPWLGQQSTRVA